MGFVEFLRNELRMRGWSVYKLSAMVNIPPSTIKGWLYGGREPSVTNAQKVAKVLGTTVEEMSEETERRVETLEDITGRLLLTQPVSIPVYTKLQLSQSEAREEPVLHIYRIREKAMGRNIEAYIIKGQYLKLDVSDGDIVLVDRDLLGESGDVVLCLVGEEMILGQLVLEGDLLWVVVNKRKIKFEECLVSAKVIEVRKKLE